MENESYEKLLLSRQLCFPLYAASKEIVRRYRPYLDRLDLTYTQYIAMMALWEHRHLSAKELGEKLYLDSGTLTPVLKSLERKGYVSRCRSRTDERVLLVELTEAGEQLRDAALPIPDEIACCVKLSPEEGLTLYSLLYKLLGGLPCPDKE